MPLRIMIGAGGTGGHVYPALAAAEALRTRAGTYELAFVGTRGGGGFERQLVDQADVSFDAYTEVYAGPVVGVNPLRALASLLKMLVGTLQALLFVARFRPAGVLLTGGWANIPVALAAALVRCPMLVYLPDIEPGRTIQLLARFARRVAITVPEAAQYFREGQTVVTGYPLRRAVMQATREEAIAHFDLDPGRTTLLVTGGSRGARSINQALEAILPQLLAENVQIIHITGRLDWERSCSQTASLVDAVHYHAFPYLDDEMGLALAAADVILARAGASTLGEIPYFGAAAVLVPYPYAWRYQHTNAMYLAERGAALHLADADMETQLLPLLHDLLRDPQRLREMQAAARSLRQADGAGRLADELVALAEGTR